MSTWARSNSAGEILEIRTFVEGEMEPVDIPHKDVIWRPVVEVREDHDPKTQDMCLNYECGGKVVNAHHYPVGKDIEKLRTEVLATLRLRYHEKTLDAMPDMKLVEAVCADRDELYNLALGEKDYAALRRMTDA